MLEPSPRYHAALRASQQFHATHKTFNGRFFWRYIEDVKALCDEFECKTLLDYGCGKGVQWETPMATKTGEPFLTGQLAADYLGVEVTKFDPAWPPFAKEPEGDFDIVVCTQVLGSIPIVDLPWATERLYWFAKKAVYVGERLGPVKKNVHRHMKAEMPHEWTHEQWAEVLRRPESPIVMVLKTTDGRSGETVTRLERLNNNAR